MAHGPVVLVCGSRSWDRRGPVLERLKDLPPTAVIVEGGAAGADRHARGVAIALGLHVATVNARWDCFGRAAGPRRNAAMLALKPDRVLAFWDGGSPGTKHMIGLAEKAGVPVEVVRS